jgi:hypothetical protein
LELALLDWHRSADDAKKPFPLVQIDFANTVAADVGLFTVLEAPHRIADGLFLACEIKEIDKRANQPEALPSSRGCEPRQSNRSAR